MRTIEENVGSIEAGEVHRLPIFGVGIWGYTGEPLVFSFGCYLSLLRRPGIEGHLGLVAWRGLHTREVEEKSDQVTSDSFPVDRRLGHYVVLNRCELCSCDVYVPHGGSEKGIHAWKQERIGIVRKSRCCRMLLAMSLEEKSVVLLETRTANGPFVTNTLQRSEPIAAFAFGDSDDLGGDVVPGYDSEAE